MNYCTKCSSYYQTPGTCNCFAATRPAIYPWVPTYHYPITPTLPTYPWPGTTITVTAKPGDLTWYNATPAAAGTPITSGYSVPVVT